MFDGAVCIFQVGHGNTDLALVQFGVFHGFERGPAVFEATRDSGDCFLDFSVDVLVVGKERGQWFKQARPEHFSPSRRTSDIPKVLRMVGGFTGFRQKDEKSVAPTSWELPRRVASFADGVEQSCGTREQFEYFVLDAVRTSR